MAYSSRGQSEIIPKINVCFIINFLNNKKVNLFNFFALFFFFQPIHTNFVQLYYLKKEIATTKLSLFWVVSDYQAN